MNKEFDVHGPYCPTDCLGRCAKEDVLEVFDDVGLSDRLDRMKVGDSIQVGYEDEYTIYRKEDEAK